MSSSVLATTILTNATKIANTTAAAKATTAAATPAPQYMGWQSWLCTVLVFLMLVVLTLRIYPSTIVVLTTLTAMWCCNIITEKDALAGWSSTGLITVMALFGLMDVALRGNLLRRGINLIMGVGKRPNLDLTRQMICFAAVSAFLNNTPLVSLMVPISKEWARKYGLAPSKFLMALEFAILAGGMCTVVGTSTTVVVQGLIATDAPKLPPGSTIGFWDIGAMGLPACVSSIIYLAVLGYRLLPEEKGGLFRHTRQHAGEFLMQFVIPDTHEWIGRPINATIASVYPPDEAKVLEVLRPLVPGQVAASLVWNQDGQHVVVQPRAVGAQAPTGGDVGALWHPGAAPTAVAYDPAPRTVQSHQPPFAADFDGAQDVFAGAQDVFAGASPSRSSQPGLEVEMMSPLGKSSESRHLLSDDSAGQPNRRIFPVEPEEVFVAGDAVVLSLNSHGALNLENQARLPALELLSRTSLRGVVRDLVEVVLSDTSPLVGHHPSASHVNAHYADTIVVAMRHDGQTVSGQANLTSSSLRLSSGDVLLLMTKPEMVPQLQQSKDFLVVSRVSSSSPKKPTWQDIAAIIILLGVFAAFFSQDVPTELAAIVGCCVAVLIKLVTTSEMIATLDGDLFILIGASIGVGQAISDSGLAGAIGTAISQAGLSAEAQLVIVYLVTMCITEIVTNNAAATIMYPIAKAVAQASKLNVKSFALCVAMAASSGHIIPIGYQCHLMVMGPGGYSMKDFAKVGVGMNIIFFAVTIGILPKVYPLS